MSHLFQLAVDEIRQLLDCPVAIICHFGSRYWTAFGMAARLKTEDIVVQSETIPLALILYHARMIASCPWRVVHDVSLMFPWSRWRLAHGIANALWATCRGEGKVIPIATFPEPRTFLIVFYLTHCHYFPLGWDHVFCKFNTIRMWIAPVHISPSVVVNPYWRVDVVPVFLSPYKWLA